MKHISRTIAYITLGALGVVSVLLYMCPFSLSGYAAPVVAAVDCDSLSSGMRGLSASPATGGCLSAHIAAGDNFIATMPRLMTLLFALTLVIIFVRKKSLALFVHIGLSRFTQMRQRYRRHNSIFRFLFEKKFRAWLILQQRVVVAHSSF